MKEYVDLLVCRFINDVLFLRLGIVFRNMTCRIITVAIRWIFVVLSKTVLSCELLSVWLLGLHASYNMRCLRSQKAEADKVDAYYHALLTCMTQFIHILTAYCALI